MKTLYTGLLFVVAVLGCVPAVAQLGKCKGKYFGNITAYSVPSNYTDLWNQTTSENGSKWGSCDRGNGQYNFENSDLAYNTAKNSGGAFKFHALIWGAQAPSYLANSSPEVIETAIRNWYQAVQDHYDPMGGLEMIDVLNEPVNTPIDREVSNLKAALTMGYQREVANQGDLNNPYGWAIWCFQLARKHFPNSVLLINEFNIEHNWGNCREEYVNMSNAIKNAPNLTDGRKNLIDGIGLQAHGIETLTAANWRNCIDDVYNRTGLPIHISELDIAADPNEAHQKTKFEEFVTIAWEHPNVAGITLWGYVQGSTWRPGNGQTGSGGTDTGIMYANGQDRPAMTWIREYFASLPTLSCCPDPAPFAGCNGPQDPEVTITSPSSNEGFVEGTAITITASATDEDGTISIVEFFEGNTKLGEDATAPYEFVLNGASLGSHTITAVATDNSGASTTSEEVTFKVNVPQVPYGGTAHPIPGIVQIEEYDLGGNGFAYMDDSPGSETGVNYRTDEDVDIEECTDTDGGYNLGWASSGEWLEYTVDVQKPGIYSIDFRVACDGDGRTVSLSIDDVDVASDLAIPNTAGWQTWQTVTVSDITLLPGKKVVRLTIGAEDYININYLEFNLIEEFIQEPFNGTAHVIPGRIETEEYDNGGEGLGFHEANAEGNQGGATFRNDEVDIEETGDVEGDYNIGYTLTGEWLAYTVDVQATGDYDLDLRLAKDGDGGVLHIEIDGVDATGPIAVPNTGGWQVWETVTLEDIVLTAGEHDMRIVFDSDYTNINYVEFKGMVTAVHGDNTSQITVFPNPFDNKGVTITCDGDFSYEITSVNGIVLDAGRGTDQLTTTVNLPTGVFHLSITTAEGVSIVKIAKN